MAFIYWLKKIYKIFLTELLFFYTRDVVLVDKKRGSKFALKTDGLSAFCLKLPNKTMLDPNEIGMLAIFFF